MCSTCARVARTHGGLLNLHTETFFNLHTERREGKRGEEVPFSLSLPAVIVSLLSQQQ